MAQVAVELLTGIPQYYQPANFLFASKENSGEFLKAQVADIQRKLQKHIEDRGGSILLVAHARLYLVSITQNNKKEF